MRAFTAIVQAMIAARPIFVFDQIMPIDLTSIFTGYGPLPAVTSVKDQTGDWDGVGQSRTVILSDGSSARESINQYKRPHYFSYTVSQFTGMLRFITTSAAGEWWFEDNPSSGGTHIKWSYTFNSRSLLTAPILWFVTNILWRGYMNKALTLCKSQIENSAGQASHSF